jgi:hypothetical protein
LGDQAAFNFALVESPRDRQFLDVRQHPRCMRIQSRRMKVTLVTLAVVALVLGICATQYYVVELNGPAYEEHHWGLRPSQLGDLALVTRHLDAGSLRHGDLALFDLHYVNKYGHGVFHFVRVVERPPDVHTGQFAWVVYFPGNVKPEVEEAAYTNVVFRGRVDCIVRLPWAWLR